jgi:hypothetical protein
MWLRQHLARSGHYVQPLDNGIAAVDDVAALRRLCRRFGPAHIQRYFDRWMYRSDWAGCLLVFDVDIRLLLFPRNGVSIELRAVQSFGPITRLVASVPLGVLIAARGQERCRALPARAAWDQAQPAGAADEVPTHGEWRGAAECCAAHLLDPYRVALAAVPRPYNSELRGL